MSVYLDSKFFKQSSLTIICIITFFLFDGAPSYCVLGAAASRFIFSPTSLLNRPDPLVGNLRSRPNPDYPSTTTTVVDRLTRFVIILIFISFVFTNLHIDCYTFCYI